MSEIGVEGFTGIPRMTHFQPTRDAFQGEDEVQGHEAKTRPCLACGIEFHPARAWQRHCRPRCRQRAYVQRRAETSVGYYDA